MKENDFLIGLIYRIINLYSLIKTYELIYVGINIKFIRNNVIKARYRKTKPEDKIEEEQMRKVYDLYQAPEF